MERPAELDELIGKRETTFERLLSKFKKNPGLPLGIASFIGIGIYGAMQYKNRTMKTSVYLINLRVAAQGAVVVCLGATLFYKVITEELIPKLAGEKKN